MAQDNQFPPGWKFSPMVTMDHVWDMFIIMSLLDDSRRRQQALVVQQKIEQALRFQHQMALRNQRMRAYGQPLARRHHCVKCTRLYKGPNDQCLSSHRRFFICSLDVCFTCRYFCCPSNCRRWGYDWSPLLFNIILHELTPLGQRPLLSYPHDQPWARMCHSRLLQTGCSRRKDLQ